MKKLIIFILMILLSSIVFGLNSTDFNRLYRFNEESGTNIKDFGSDALNFSAVAGSWLNFTGKIDKGINLSEDTYHIAGTAYLNITKTTPFYLSFWLKGDNNPASDAILMHTSDSGMHRYIQLKTDGRISMGIFCETGALRRDWISTRSLINGSNVHVSFNGTTNDVDIFLNDKKDAITNFYTGDISTCANDPAGNSKIGIDSGGQDFIMDILNVKVKNMLSASERSEQYNDSFGTEYEVSGPEIPINNDSINITFIDIFEKTNHSIYWFWNITGNYTSSLLYLVGNGIAGNLSFHDPVLIFNGTLQSFNHTELQANRSYAYNLTVLYNETLFDFTESHFSTDTLSNNITCSENWFGSQSACVNNSQILTYEDLNMCGTYNDLPLDNGTISSCDLITGGAIGVPNSPTFLSFLFLSAGLILLTVFSIVSLKKQLMTVKDISIMFIIVTFALLIATLIISAY